VRHCVDLYSSEYGVWGPHGPSPGGRVQISEDYFRRLVDDETVGIACAYAGTELVGHCVAAWIDAADKGRLAWVSQLVVHTTYRRARVATTLLYSTWSSLTAMPGASSPQALTPFAPSRQPPVGLAARASSLRLAPKSTLADSATEADAGFTRVHSGESFCATQVVAQQVGVAGVRRRDGGEHGLRVRPRTSPLQV
jgi:Acetyltransferase (GNAT) family